MAKMVECNTCGKEISSGAKKCPHCGQKRGGLIGKILLWGFIGFIGLAIIGSLLGDPDGSPTRTASSSSAAPETIYAIGDTVNSGDFSISVKSVTTRSRVGSSFVEEVAGNGGIFIVVEFSYRNETNEPISAFRAPDAELRDPNDVKYSHDLGQPLAMPLYETSTRIHSLTSIRASKSMMHLSSRFLGRHLKRVAGGSSSIMEGMTFKSQFHDGLASEDRIWFQSC